MEKPGLIFDLSPHTHFLGSGFSAFTVAHGKIMRSYWTIREINIFPWIRMPRAAHNFLRGPSLMEERVTHQEEKEFKTNLNLKKPPAGHLFCPSIWALMMLSL